MKNNYINLEDISSFLVEVSEEISNKNIDTFITTSYKSLNTNNFTNPNIFYTYLDLSNEYQILSYDSSIVKITQIELLIELLDDKFLNLVAFENYFLLFKGRELYFLQNITSELKDEDLDLYIKKRFNFNIEKRYHLSKSDLTCQTNSLTNKLKYIKNNKSLNFFYLFTLSLLLIFIFSNIYINYENANEYEKNLAKINSNIKNNNTHILKEQLYEKIVFLFNDLSHDNININKVNFNKNKIELNLSSINKENLYKFFKKHKNIKINSLKYIENKKQYETNTNFSF